MDLRTYLDLMPHGGISDFAHRLGISPVYLHQLAARQDGREPSPELCVLIERESQGVVTRAELRPDSYHRIWPELARAAAPEVQQD